MILYINYSYKTKHALNLTYSYDTCNNHLPRKLDMTYSYTLFTLYQQHNNHKNLIPLLFNQKPKPTIPKPKRNYIKYAIIRSPYHYYQSLMNLSYKAELIIQNSNSKSSIHKSEISQLKTLE